MGAVVLDLDEAKDIGASRLVGWPDRGDGIRYQQSEDALSRDVFVDEPFLPMLC